MTDNLAKDIFPKVNVMGRSGRAGVLGSMDGCTKCGICHSHCPVANVTNAFPGPKYTGPQAERFRTIEKTSEVSPLLCSGCGVCTSVCPNNVAIADIITLAKAGLMQDGRKVSMGQRLLNRPNLIGRFASITPFISNVLLNNYLIRQCMEVLFGIHREAPLPKVYGRKFAKWFSKRKQPDGPIISYFTGCAVTNYDPYVGIALIKVLNFLGYRVKIPTDLCCSLPMLSSGEMDAAAPRAREVINELYSSAIRKEKIISTSTSCSLTVKSKYGLYLNMTDQSTSSVSNAIFDACEFLRDYHIESLQSYLRPICKEVLYHGPCQLRGHSMGQPALEVLNLIPGLKVKISEADCCGIGGTYGYEKNKYRISNLIGKTLRDQVRECQPDIIICDSETCRWSIQKQTSIETIHPVQLINESLGLSP